MGSKKHKKESKKKKHRSRSRSPLDGEERERKRHKKHKDRKKDRSPDVEEVPLDSHLVPESVSDSYRDEGRDNGSEHVKERSRDKERDKEREREREKEKQRSSSPAEAPGGGAQESLSIADTNRLRAKLGLKPLAVREETADDGKIKDDLGEFYHKPAVNITEQKKTEKIREKLEERKEKRKIEQKLKTTLLAEESDDEDAIAWVKKSRQIEQQKKEAARRAAALDEMDEVFGVSALLEDERRLQRQRGYGAHQLRGLRVGHRLNDLESEREVVLTLADGEVLGDGDDVLVNVNLEDEQRYRKNIEERKKAKAGYQAYDDEEALQAAALGLARPVLAKYDEEEDHNAKGFVIGQEHLHKAPVPSLEERVSWRLESLAGAAPQPARDYLDHGDVGFRKLKRKGKIRKRVKAEPIDVDAEDAGAAPLLTDDTELKPVVGLPEDAEETEPDAELQAALQRARRARQRQAASLPKVEEVLQSVSSVKEEAEDLGEGMSEDVEGSLVLDATAEFCRTLGAAPDYRPAPVAHDSEPEEMEAEPAGSAWSRVDVGSERPADLAAGSGAGLEAEPALGAGVAGALRLALSKGYLERQGAPPPPARPPPLLHAHYCIEDKAAGDDDKYSGRRGGGGGGGPIQEFREKSQFRPNIKLDYVDDDGRALCPKEAFRYLSHKFHGKGPGKNKQEKRIKKAVQEGLMKKMSSTDTPLNTLQMLQEKQRETHSAYVVLSGKRDATN